ncbi:hypothetical protein K0817_016275 [Microbacterium sp. HD4P20]|uniref:lipopolysaccharide biosynthesis protein n=1 Tax=Microbacterium sp. HD4P20 TaxID=2864874 RepID=UPI001C644001|nr:hypothetical protein [Microbacterium sp. HD4P20]MCP2638110.1 hypothetical protein [Microbacterium sp. HD4P20]
MAISFGGRAGAAVAQAFLLALLARSLGVDDFGTYAVTYATCMFGFGVLDYGLTVRALAARGIEDVRGLFGALAIFKAAAFLLAMVVVAIILSTGLVASGPPQLLLFVSVLSAAGDAFGNTSLVIQQGERRTWSATGWQLIRRLLALIPFAFGLTLTTAFACLAILGISGVVIFFVLAIRRAGRPTPLMSILRANHSSFLVGLGPNIAQLDSAALGATAGAQVAGLYGASTRLAAPMNLVVVSMMQVAVPEMAGDTDPNRRAQIFRASRRTALGLAAAFLLGSPLAPVITEIMLGDQFGEAAPIVGGVMVAAGFIAISQAYLGWFNATHIPKSVGYSMLCSAVLRVIACATIGAIWGPWGLALVLPVTAVLTLTALHIIWLRTRSTMA